MPTDEEKAIARIQHARGCSSNQATQILQHFIMAIARATAADKNVYMITPEEAAQAVVTGDVPSSIEPPGTDIVSQAIADFMREQAGGQAK